MADSRTPIERMIDHACGVDRHTFASMVQLRCPQCRRTKRVPRDRSDLPGTAVVQARCPGCVGGEFDEIFYFDVDGKQIIEEQ